VAPDGLHLRAATLDGRLQCSEVISDDVFALGLYEYSVSSDIARMDSALVLGLFTYSYSADYDHHEIDLEASRWGDPENDNMQFRFRPGM
jgi:hypothetical protein